MKKEKYWTEKSEANLVTQWLWKHHRTDLQWTRKRLGALPMKELAKMYSVMMRWVDAIFISDGVVYLVEAKLRPGPGAIGQLDFYEKLFPQTLEFSEYRTWPIKKILLTSYADLQMAEWCAEKDVEFIVFQVKSREEWLEEQKKKIGLI